MSQPNKKFKIEESEESEKLLSDWFDAESKGLLALVKPGDILEFKEIGYSHYGIYTGDNSTQGSSSFSQDDGDVIHHSKDGPLTGTGVIKIQYLSSFEKQQVRVNNTLDKCSPRRWWSTNGGDH